MKKFQHVDVLRGVAVLLVVLIHFGKFVPSDQFVGQISKFGQYGVQLFFVMSAFTLCHSMRNSSELTSAGYLSFMIRRFFRIAPLYYLAIPIYFLVTFISIRSTGKTPFYTTGDYTISSVLANVFFVHGLYPPGNNNIVPGGWSIGAEFLFYAVFPFLFHFAKRRRMILGYAALVSLIATLGLVLLRWKFGRMDEVGVGGFVYFSVFNQFPCFALGMLYYFDSKNRLFNLGMKFLTPLSAVLLVVLHQGKWGMLFTPLLAGICSVGVALFLENRSVPSIFSKIGQLSFSIYIFHFLPVWIWAEICRSHRLESFQSDAFSLLVFSLIVTITYLIALFSNRSIEVPCIAIGHKLSARIRTP